MSATLNIAVSAARAAGSLIIRSLNQLDSLQVTAKARNEFVSEVDRQAEQEILRVIRKAYPDHAFLAEESGEHGEGDTVWIIDPLDGTTNFLHGFPQFAVSIALSVAGRLECGVVYDPMRQELFTATRGGGAQLDGRRIRVSKRTQLQESLLGTGFPYRANLVWMESYLGMLREAMENTAGVRRPGAAALDLAYVAAGRLDGFWEFGLAPWDVAAGTLLIREAGGRVSDFEGGDGFMTSGNIVGGNPKIYAQLSRLLAPHYARGRQAQRSP
jgi:myo-inositol-1(or 4)-monophosphatase